MYVYSVILVNDKRLPGNTQKWTLVRSWLIRVRLVHSWADPTWGDIFECCFKAQSSKLKCVFSLKRGKRDVRSLSFELSKMSSQV